MGNAGITVYNDTKWPLNLFLSMGPPHHFCNGVKPGEAFTIYPGAVWYTLNVVMDMEENRISSGYCALKIAPYAVAAAAVALTGGLSIAAAAGSTGALSLATTAGITATATTELVFTSALSAFGSTLFAVIAEGVAIAGLCGMTALKAAQGLADKFQSIAKEYLVESDLKGVYCGGSHKTFKVTGGPEVINGTEWRANKFKIQEVNPKEISKTIDFRKKDGLYNAPFEYWSKSDGEWYPPKNF